MSPGSERNKTRTVKVVFLLPPCKIFRNSVESWLNGLQHVVSVLNKCNNYDIIFVYTRTKNYQQYKFTL